MADYYPLIARAVTGLDKGTGEARRALYERARIALVAQLRGVVPALSEADITRERLALEEAIRKVEAEAARRPRQPTSEWPRANPMPNPALGETGFLRRRLRRPRLGPRSPRRPPDWDELRRELDNLASPAQPEGRVAPDREPVAPGRSAPPEPSRESTTAVRAAIAARVRRNAGAGCRRPRPHRQSPPRSTVFRRAAPMANEGLKGFVTWSGKQTIAAKARLRPPGRHARCVRPPPRPRTGASA